MSVPARETLASTHRGWLLASIMKHMDQPIYLDHNATTPMAPQVVDATAEAMQAGYANPASQHQPGRRARRVIESARERIIELLGGETGGRHTDRLIFTSGGTEANNLAVFGLHSPAANPLGGVITTPIEHPSVAAAAEECARQGARVDRLPVDQQGVVDPAALEPLLRPDTRMVSAMLGNNETGTLQPVAELAAVASQHQIALHTDAVQAVGKIDVHFRSLGATALSFTAHKFHGPLGIGGLLLRGDARLQQRLFGGFQQAALRPGTESVPLVIGMQAALELWHAQRQTRPQQLSTLRDQLEQQICQNLPAAEVVASASPRLPHTSNIAFKGYDRQALFVALDAAGVACSTGSACASGSSEPSAVLLAMGCDERVVRGSLRFSLGIDTTRDEVDQAVRRILLVCKRLQPAKVG